MTAPQYKEVLKELKEIKAMYVDLDGRMSVQEQWKIAEDAYKAALSQVYNENKEKTDEQVSKAWLRVLKEVYPILAILGAILYAVAASKGIH
jgi:hypothetical protein